MPHSTGAKAFWIYNKTAVMSAHHSLRSDVTGFAVHIHFSDLGDYGLPTERIGDAATCQGSFECRAASLRVSNPNLLRGGIEDRDSPCTATAVVVPPSCLEQFQADLSASALAATAASSMNDSEALTGGGADLVSMASGLLAKPNPPQRFYRTRTLGCTFVIDVPCARRSFR